MLLLSLTLIRAPLAASADKGGNKGQSELAWERANDNASFKHGDDDHNDGRYRHRDDRDRDNSGAGDNRGSGGSE